MYFTCPLQQQRSINHCLEKLIIPFSSKVSLKHSVVSELFTISILLLPYLVSHFVVDILSVVGSTVPLVCFVLNRIDFLLLCLC